MDLSRRSFLGGVITVVGATIIKVPSPRLLIPKIYSDGIYDDWEGLDALLNGRYVDISSNVVVVKNKGSILVKGGTFKLTRSLVIKPRLDTNVVIENCMFNWSGPAEGPVFTLEDVQRFPSLT